MADTARLSMGTMKNAVGHPGAEKPTWIKRGDVLRTEEKNDSVWGPNVSPMYPYVNMFSAPVAGGVYCTGCGKFISGQEIGSV